MTATAIRVSGVVQGVGFRPYIWRLAEQFQLRGAVWNDAQGVMIHVCGESQSVQLFIRQIPLQLPPLAKIDRLTSYELEQAVEYDDFHIRSSEAEGQVHIQITPDAATCPECLTELNDSANRRYRYPFTNCTHCGPRFSIVEQIPFDRVNTSMHEFDLCPACTQEFRSAQDRRFHAQAVCCPECGPKIWLEDGQGQMLQSADAVLHATQLLQQGFIIAIKGLGGFHLACDASHEETVNRLRQRKRRYVKPLALMATDLNMVKQYCRVDEMEQTALSHWRAPILILDRLRDLDTAHVADIATSVAGNDHTLGFMLPYTPLHYLLLKTFAKPVVMTSGNISDEPQCIDNTDARMKLSAVADFILMHDRRIVNRLDDSVARKMGDQVRVLRRGRGYSPEKLALPVGFEKAPAVLAMGAELKNSFCVLQQGQAIVSQYIGDLENTETQIEYRQQIENYQQLFGFRVGNIAVDLHPGYLSTQYGQELARQCELNLIGVQHHHAHAAACMVEQGLPLHSKPVLAMIFDGLGMGENQQLWGGEFLFCDYTQAQRVGHFQPIAMPGGTQAIREPWRNAYAQLCHYFDFQQITEEYAELDFFRMLQAKPLSTMSMMIEKKLNSPPASSCGRWLDALAAVLGICSEQVLYEGQAAIELERLAHFSFDSQQRQAYPHRLLQQEGAWVLDWLPLWQAVLDDLHRQIDQSWIAARIHHALVGACEHMMLKLAQNLDFDTVVLSGGVFQNRLLLEGLTQRLRQHDKTVLCPINYPMNDGGIALGQAAIAAAGDMKTV